MTLDAVLTELVGHYAYDTGATDSGVRDACRKIQLVALWRGHAKAAGYDKLEAEWARGYWLSDEAIGRGYGVADLTKFFRWLEDC